MNTDQSPMMMMSHSCPDQNEVIKSNYNEHNSSTDSVSSPPQIGLALLLFSLTILTVVGNAMVVYAVITERRLRTVSNIYVVSLAMSDLLVGVAVMPLSAFYILLGRWAFGIRVCELWLSLDYTASTASILNLVMLSLDRYWSVTQPLKYLSKRTPKRARRILFAVWLTSALWIVPIYTWHWIEHRGCRQVPAEVCDPEYAHNQPLKITTGLLNFYIPLCLMYVLYGRIFWKIRRTGTNPLLSRTPKMFSAEHKRGLPSREVSMEIFSTTNGNTEGISPISEQVLSSRQPIAASDEMSQPMVSSPVIQYYVIHDEFVRDSLPQMEHYYYCQPRHQRHDTFKSISNEERIQALKPDGPTKIEHDQCLANPAIHVDPPSSNQDSFIDSSNSNYPISTLDFSVLGHATCSPSPETQPENESSSRSTPSLFQSRKFRRRHQDSSFVSFSSNSSSAIIRHRVERFYNKTAFYRKEMKAARQLGAILGVFTACFLPYFVLYAVVAFRHDLVPAWLMLTFTWVGYCNSTLNPIIYPLCNQHFRTKFRRMLGCHNIRTRTRLQQHREDSTAAKRRHTTHTNSTRLLKSSTLCGVRL